MKEGPPSSTLVSTRFLSAGVTERLQFLLGQRIRECRKEARLTQAALAEQVGMTRAALASIETGRQRVSVIALARLAHILAIPPGSLIPELSEAAARWDERRRAPIPQDAPMLEKELGRHNISPSKKSAGLDRALADVRSTQRGTDKISKHNRKGKETEP